MTCHSTTVIYKTRVKSSNCKLTTLAYHRRILFTDFFSQSPYLYSLKAGNDGKIHTLYEKTRERLLKNIAAYLLSQKYHPKGQTFVLLYRGQLLNWYGIDDAKGARSIWYFPRCVWGLETKEQIMEAYSRESQWNFIKFSVNQAFLSYFDFHLIDPSQACDVDTSKYWILQDMGHGSKSLRCLNE